MKYGQKSFSVPVAGPEVTQEQWDAIFGAADEMLDARYSPDCPRCQGHPDFGFCSHCGEGDPE